MAAKRGSYQAFVASFVKGGGNFKQAAAAWNRAKRGDPPRRGPGRPKGSKNRARYIDRETVVATPEGDVMAGRARTLHASIHAYTPLEWSKEELGAFWVGIVEEQRTHGGPAEHEFFPPEDCDGNVDKRFLRMAQERAIGAAIAKHAGIPLRHLGVTEQEWLSWYRQWMAETAQQALQAGTGGAAWSSPLADPSEVTSSFGASEGFRTLPHTGIDLRAPNGSTVVAPTSLRVDRIWDDPAGGLTIRASARRQDGTFPTERQGDDTGWVMFFGHLTAPYGDVRQGSEIPQGQPLAISGQTGSAARGPHLHWALEWTSNNPTMENERVFVDPTSLVPLQAIQAGAASGAMGPVLNDVDGTAKAVLSHARGSAMPGAFGPQTPSVIPSNVVIVNGGVVAIAQMGQQNLNVHDLFGLPRPGGSGQGAELSERSGPIVPVQRSLSSQFWAQMPTFAQDAMRGLGELAGSTFRLIASPEGLSLARGAAAAGTGMAAGLLGLAGVVGPLLAPLVSAIPYVGPAIGAVFTAFGPIGKVGSPLLTGASALIGGAPQPPNPLLMAAGRQ